MNNPTPLTREQNLHNWSKLSRNARKLKLEVQKSETGLRLVASRMILTTIGTQKSEKNLLTVLDLLFRYQKLSLSQLMIPMQ